MLFARKSLQKPCLKILNRMNNSCGVLVLIANLKTGIILKARQDGIMNKNAHELNPKTVCIDFDGTITEYDGKYKGVNVFGKLQNGAKKAINELYEDGWDITIYSCRGPHENIAEYLYNNGIKFHRVYHGHKDNRSHKPYAAVYIDDRAVAHTGDWKKTAQNVKKFKPFWDK